MTLPTSERVRPTEPLYGLVQAVYAAFERPAPKHLAGCGCAFCTDRSGRRDLRGVAARDWTASEVLAWMDRAGLQEKAVSRSDRAVFRFLLPRVLELLAMGALPRSRSVIGALGACLPGRAIGGGHADADLTARLGVLILDRAMWDGTWPLDVIDTLHLLVSGGWSQSRLVAQILHDPDMPAALARAWGRRAGGADLFDGDWPDGSVPFLRAHLAAPHVTERVMNYAMAEGPTAEEADAAMRAADRILRNA